MLKILQENKLKSSLLCLVAVLLSIVALAGHYITKDDKILILNRHLEFVEKIRVDDSFMMNKAKVTSFSREPVTFKYNFILNNDGTYKMETYLHIYNLVDDLFDDYDKFVVKDSKGNDVKTFDFFDIKLNLTEREGRHSSNNYYFHVDTTDNVKLDTKQSAFIDVESFLLSARTSFKKTYSISSNSFKFNVKNINLFSDFFINNIEAEYTNHPDLRNSEEGTYSFTEETPQLLVIYNIIDKDTIEIKRGMSVKGDIDVKVDFPYDLKYKTKHVEQTLKDGQDSMIVKRIKKVKDSKKLKIVD